MMNRRLEGSGFSLMVILLAACAATSAPNYSDILTNTNRPEAERNIDAVRKPQEVMAFYGVKRGQKVADIFASRGYYTAILSQLVGPEGLVYSANTASRQELHDRLKQPGMSNVRVIDGPFVNFQGVVDDMNPERGRMKVVVPVFGRPTSVELEYYQVERI